MIIFFRKIFLPLHFKNITLKNIMIFIGYLTPYYGFGKVSQVLGCHTLSPFLDWEMVICGSKFNKRCSKIVYVYKLFTSIILRANAWTSYDSVQQQEVRGP